MNHKNLLFILYDKSAKKGSQPFIMATSGGARITAYCKKKQYFVSENCTAKKILQNFFEKCSMIFSRLSACSMYCVLQIMQYFVSGNSTAKKNIARFF